MSAGDRPLLLVVRDLGLGDLLTGIPALRALCRAFPGHDRVLVAPPVLAGLVEAALEPEGGMRVVADAAALDRRPELGVDLHGNGPLSHGWVLASRPRRFLGFAHPAVAESARCPAWRADEHEVARWCRLLAEAGIPADPDDLDLDPTRLGGAAGLPRDAAGRGPTLVHPGAAAGARRWPTERFAAVARHEAAAGRPVLVSGGPDEVGLARAVAVGAGLASDAVVAGTTDLVALARLVAGCERVVCGDTGVAHLATALRVPSVVLFGPTPVSWWGPPPGRPWHVALEHGAGGGDPHGAVCDERLAAIGVDEVLAALARLPERFAVPVPAPGAA